MSATDSFDLREAWGKMGEHGRALPEQVRHRQCGCADPLGSSHCIREEGHSGPHESSTTMWQSGHSETMIDKEKT